MNRENFDKIIDFAVEREKAAVDFYHELQGKAKFEAQKEMLKEFEEMEKGHIVILENIRKKGFENLDEKKIIDLKISDYIVPVEPSDDMDYQDILIIAMKREEAATKLYSDMAARFPGSDIQKMFLRLSVEEAGHKLKFEKLYDEDILREN